MKLLHLLPVLALITIRLQADAPDTPAAKPAPAKPAPENKVKAALATPVQDVHDDDALPNPYIWRITGGAQYRQLGSLSFHGATRAPGLVTPLPTAHPPQIGDPGVIGNRTYNDGFVNKDISGSSTTWNWGYNNAGQLNGTNLSFHATGTVLTNEGFDRSFNNNWNDDPSGAGGFVKFESPEMGRYKDISFSAEAGYSFTHTQSSHTATAFQVNQQSDFRSINVTDVYDTTGIVVPVAPYAGSFNGPGPIISNLPASRTITTTGDTVQNALLTSTLRSRLSTNLNTLSFGGAAHYDVGRVRLGLSSGLAIDITNWEAQTHEDFRNSTTGQDIRQWDSRHIGTDVHPAFYMEASASVQLTERWSFFTSGRYDWAGSMHGSVDGSTFGLNLGGWTLAAGMTLKF